MQQPNTNLMHDPARKKLSVYNRSRQTDRKTGMGYNKNANKITQTGFPDGP